LRPVCRPAAGRLQDRVDEARLARRGRAARFEGIVVSLRTTFVEKTMSRTSLLALISAALLCAAPPAGAQQAQPDFPEGPGKQTFVNLCGACHAINRVRARYTPERWHTRLSMMINFDVHLPHDVCAT